MEGGRGEREVGERERQGRERQGGERESERERWGGGLHTLISCLSRKDRAKQSFSNRLRSSQITLKRSIPRAFFCKREKSGKLGHEAKVGVEAGGRGCGTMRLGQCGGEVGGKHGLQMWAGGMIVGGSIGKGEWGCTAGRRGSKFKLAIIQ